MRRLLIFIGLFLLYNGPYSSFSQELPIKPSRTISFTTDIGTGINLDLSPDGKTLVFDLLGDLYTISARGGKAIQLTRGIGLKVDPVWSHDGRQIVYISDISGTPHLIARDVSGKFHKILGAVDKSENFRTPSLVWSYDDNFVGATNLSYNVANGSEESLPDSIGQIIGSSADGKFWYCSNGRKLYKYNKEDNTNAIVAISKPILTCTSSDNGKWLVYTTYIKGGTSLMATNLVNGREKTLVPSVTVHPYHKISFSFSPDSKSIYISYGGKIHKVGVEDGSDRIIPFTCDVKVDLGPLDHNTFRLNHGVVKVRYARSASKSPDGKHLVFSAMNTIYIKDLPGGKPHVLYAQPFNQYQPCWSPDGKWIAYVSWCDTTGGELWKVAASRGTPVQLTKVPGQYQRPVWSPDGKTVAVVKGAPALGDRDERGIGQVQLVSIENGKVLKIADSVPLWNQLAFSLDGSRIIYEPDAGYYSHYSTKMIPQLVSKKINGSCMKILADRKAGGETDQPWLLQRSLSPDGKYIVFSAGEDLCLLPVAKTDKAVLIYDDSQKLPTIRFAKGIDPIWDHGGKVLCWTYAHCYYEINPNKIVAAAAKKSSERNEFGFENGGCITVTVSPDRSIPLMVTVQTNFAHGTVALKNARIITMRGSQVITNGIILIKDGRFVTVGAADKIRIPKRVKIVDLSGKTIIPGFVDMHLHMRLPPDVFPQQSWIYLVNLAYGVTTARDPSSSYDSFGYSELLRAGRMIGPRLFSSGRAVRTQEGIHLNDFKDALNTVEKRQLLGGTFMKHYILPTRVQREWLLMAARKQGLNMTNEGGTQGWLQVLGMLKDGSSGVEHNFDGDTYEDVITLIAKSGTYFTPTLQVTPRPGAKEYFNYKYWHGTQKKLARFNHENTVAKSNGGEGYNWITNEKPNDTTDASFIYADGIDAAIRKAGGLVTVGSHGNDEGIGVHNEIWALKMGGITNMEALQAATIMGAGALGIQKDIGSIEPGKIADLIILNSNPLEDIHNTRDIQYVMKDGILYDGGTLDELWPVKKKCPEWQLHHK